MQEQLTIQSTTDYSTFQLMNGNRSLDVNHVEKLKAAMLENPQWFQTKPAVVNEYMFVIDGQHRLQACKQTGLPFYYVIGDKMNLSAARAMNIRQKQWSIKDYAQSYADAGNKNYQFVLRMARNNPSLSLGVIINIAAGTTMQGFDLSSNFRAGRFEVEDENDAMAVIDVLSQISKLSDRRINVPFVRTYIQVSRRDDFDEARFLKNLASASDRLVIGGLARDNFRSIEDVYNYHYSEANWVRFY